MNHELPQALLSSLAGIPGFDRQAFERVHAAGGAPVSVRLNPGKVEDGPEVIFPSYAGRMPSVPWSSWGYYLPERPSFTLDPLFHAGAYYVQEASSMFLEEAFRRAVLSGGEGAPLRVLDCCAAPGGKSTLIESLLTPGSLLVSNEVIKTRVSILQENMVKWGSVRTVVSSNDPRDFGRMENYFDVIVADAPCSGSGLFRREPEAIREWSPGNVALCSQRQQRILADCWPALRRDGIFIYSTCSYSMEEDEAILDWMMDNFEAESCRLELKPDWGIVETIGKKGGYGYRFFPDKVSGEGLFISVIRKRDGDVFSYPRVKKPMVEKLSKAEEQRMASWVHIGEGAYFFRHNELVHVLPESLREDLGYLQSMLYLKKAGVTMGRQAGDELIPEHELALSRILTGNMPVADLSREDAIRYLRKEDLSIDAQHRGWTLVRYAGQNLGWVKILPNRVNNYYPKEWRILKKDP